MTRLNHKPRINYQNVSPEGLQAMYQLERFVRHSGLDHQLLELVKTRASQLNGCAFCIDMHTKDARLAGETEQRLYALNAWEETPFFTERERAALAWTEALTNIQQGHAADAVYQQVKTQFSEAELVSLTLAITTINAWNRLSLAFRVVPGTYEPAKTQAVQA